MKTFIFIFLILTAMVLCGCDAGIKRQGYTIEDVAVVDIFSCSIAIKKDFAYTGCLRQKSFSKKYIATCCKISYLS